MSAPSTWRLAASAALAVSVLVFAAWAWGASSVTPQKRAATCLFSGKKRAAPLFTNALLSPTGKSVSAQRSLKVRRLKGKPKSCWVYLQTQNSKNSIELAQAIQLQAGQVTRRTVPKCSRTKQSARSYKNCLKQRRKFICSKQLKGAALAACKARVSKLLAPVKKVLWRGPLSALKKPRRLLRIKTGKGATVFLDVSLPRTTANSLQRTHTQTDFVWLLKR